jgi:hypothetical protein
MLDAACNFVHQAVHDAKYDITWSFQYSLCGLPGSTGGFTTFLYDANVATLTGGGIRSGLGYGPFVDLSNLYDGIQGAVLGVGFDSTGQFSTAQQGFSTGLSLPILNSYTCRTSANFFYVGAYSAPFNILETFEQYRTLRFNLTDVGQTLNVHAYDDVTKTYNLLNSFSTQLLFVYGKRCKIGISYASPISAENGAVLKIKHFHSHGRV